RDDFSPDSACRLGGNNFRESLARRGGSRGGPHSAGRQGPLMDTAMSLILLALSPFLFANRPTVVLPPRGPRHAREVVRYAQPLHITSGGTYSGNWESLTPSVAAVWITTSEPVVIENCRIRSAGDAIQSYNANA